ncbi:ribosome biogenesis factor YjgA [Thiomicrospira microaerophila]|uniref:ribosome biogenesis factor YjgA n=1 Tax=Thiomicrospira microaerophila TaxID=406020 RepID=UPI0005C80498|nr:ribosome biogenesis factor YjgA [Thiomicrospira microaerophila]
MVRPRNVNRVVRKKPVPEWEQEEFTSRTDIKLAAQEVTDIGSALGELSESQLKKMGLPTELLDALLLYKRMDPGPAIRRQRQFIGKWLRQHEEELAELRAKIEEMEARAKQQNLHFQKLERWRDRLITEGDEALTALLEDFPQADRTLLRQHIRNAQKEAEQQKPPKAARAIFQYLRGLEW